MVVLVFAVGQQGQHHLVVAGDELDNERSQHEAWKNIVHIACRP